MFPTMMLTFREGVEAFLIIAITALYLRNTGRADLLGALRWGIAVAIAGSVLLGIVLARAGGISPLWEGALALLAMVLVLGCTMHMMRHGRHMAQQIRDQIDASSARGGRAAYWSVFLFTLVMIGREGVETAALLAAMAGAADMRSLFLGGLTGISLAALLALAWARLGKRVNLARFFQVTAVAIPAVLAYNTFTRHNRLMLAELDSFAHDVFTFMSTGHRIDDATRTPERAGAPRAVTPNAAAPVMKAA